MLTIKHAVRFSTGGKDSHRLISAQFALLAFELFATRARRFFIVAVEKESREQQRRGKEKKKTRRRRRRRRRRRGVLLFSSRALLLFKIPTPSSQRLRARELERDGGPRREWRWGMVEGARTSGDQGRGRRRKYRYVYLSFSFFFFFLLFCLSLFSRIFRFFIDRL